MGMRSLCCVADLILPERCVLCARPLLGCRAGSYPVCRYCCNTLHPLQGVRCALCGTVLLSEREVCLDCRERTHHFALHRSAFAYDDQTAELLRAFKAEATRSLGKLFGPALLGLYRQHCTGALLVPVPGHPAATRRRGWDQAHELCLSMSRLAELELNRALRRLRSRRQKELTFAERQTNLSGRIRVTADSDTLAGRSVALVDDVYTTGATLDACCQALQAAGVKQVFAFTVAMDL